MIILACATALELDHAQRLLKRDPDGAVRSGGNEFLPAVVGIGPVAAALSAGMLLSRHPKARGILNLGICGSFAGHPLGSPCVATAEIWPEYGVHFSDGSEETFSHQMFEDLRLDPANRVALDPAVAAAAMGLTVPTQWFQGPSLTVAGVSGDPQRAEMLRSRHDAATENMEGFGLALAASRNGIPFLEVRTVSNPVGVRDKKRWNFRLALDALKNVIPSLTGVSP